MKEVKRTERGWAGHFISADKCLFRRNTLLEYGDTKVVVSTVGRMVLDKEFFPIGHNRHFETMAFIVKDDDPYNDANVNKPVHFKSNWELPEPDMELEADEMHEDVVAEISESLLNDSIAYDDYSKDLEEEL